MRNPFHSEVEAFHFVLLTIAAFAAIALASLLGGPWAGIAVWAAVTAAAVIVYLRRRPDRQVREAPTHMGSPDERRVLVVANEVPADERLVEAIDRAAAGRRARVLVVAPALVSHVRHWTSDLDAAQTHARQPLDATLGLLRAAGLEARGEIGDEDPLLAIDDALRTFGADAIIIATHPEGHSNWLERGVVARAQEHYAVPITHLVIESTPTARGETPRR
jgi:GABA permease